MKKMSVAPSILSADFSRMGEAVARLKDWGADMVHCDVMDGVYVPNITFGMPMVRDIRKCTDLPIDAHLMITRPEKYVEQFCDAGADIVTFHPEACESEDKVIAALNAIRAKGKKCGLVVNADMDVDIVTPYLNDVDMILIMTVQAGFGGQSFKHDCLKKAAIVRDLCKEKGIDVDIELDGGISPSNAPLAKEAGATVLVAGNSVFKSADPKATVAAMQLPLD